MSGSDILVVEDNEQNYELVEYLLDEAGMTVRRAADAEAARRELARELPDLILMDMHLPGMDGLALTAEIRGLPGGPAVPIVALTAHAMRGDRERFLAGGCDGYIAKPIDVKTFAAEIARYLALERGSPAEETN